MLYFIPKGEEQRKLTQTEDKPVGVTRTLPVLEVKNLNVVLTAILV